MDGVGWWALAVGLLIAGVFILSFWLILSGLCFLGVAIMES